MENFLFDFNIPEEEETFGNSKKDILRYLSDIGVDTRFISYTSDKIYINNLRFSKFSRRRQNTFEKHFPNFKVIRSSLFQEIVTNASRELSSHIKPKVKVLILDDANPLIPIILEPYTRKYGISLVYDDNDDYDLITSNKTLDTEVHSIVSEIFSGEGISFPRKKENYIYPLIKVSNSQINDFLGEKLVSRPYDDVAEEFLEFLDDTVAQYKPNILASVEYLENNQKI
ncbi:ATPase [Methanobrevibacter sp. 87.7]|uniref:ATPase n=1 Tax=Methanobrevibacter sp. 87.7 TaxID=387957 RepID=UPI000B513A5E|nr:ATPase [Methanobrevibacter sp. 87.7]OWT33801.1 ATPase [Methanobrevibacter sp. 87.7]